MKMPDKNKQNIPRNIDFFIKFFKDLPSEYITLSTEVNPLDAWCWIETDIEAHMLYDIIKPYGFLLAANDGLWQYKNLADNPKDRVVAFLESIKRKESLKHERQVL